MACKDYNGNVVPCPEGMKKGTVLDEVEVTPSYSSTKQKLSFSSTMEPIKRSFSKTIEPIKRVSAKEVMSSKIPSPEMDVIRELGVKSIKEFPIQHKTKSNIKVSDVTKKAFSKAVGKLPEIIKK